MDYTGTGNSLNMRNPYVLQLVMDSLRYWVTEMHVDGFRFDLASTLARGLHEVDRLSAFFDLIQQDPIISQVKLIAEPWDVGEGGYQVGNFPPQWAEWNGKYRDCIRDYLARSPIRPSANSATASRARATCTRTTAAGLMRASTSSPPMTVSHCRDLVSYNDKHNEANGEDNHDGDRRQPLVELRRRGSDRRRRYQRVAARQQRNLFYDAVALAGYPHDARRRRARSHASREQQRLLPRQRDLVVRLGARRREPAVVHPRLIEFRHDHPGAPPPNVLPGPADPRHGRQHIAWFTPAGDEMEEPDWAEGFAKTLGVFLERRRTRDGAARRGVHRRQLPVRCRNADYEPVVFTFPPSRRGDDWSSGWTQPGGRSSTEHPIMKPGAEVDVAGRSMVFFPAEAGNPGSPRKASGYLARGAGPTRKEHRCPYGDRTAGARSVNGSTSTSRKGSTERRSQTTTSGRDRGHARSTRNGPEPARPARRVRRRSKDISSGRRGGLRSHRGPGGRTYRELYAEAQHRRRGPLEDDEGATRGAVRR